MGSFEDIMGEITAHEQAIGEAVSRVNDWVGAVETVDLEKAYNDAIEEAIGNDFDETLRTTLAQYGFNLPVLEDYIDEDGNLNLAVSVDGLADPVPVVPTHLYSYDTSEIPPDDLGDLNEGELDADPFAPDPDNVQGFIPNEPRFMKQHGEDDSSEGEGQPTDPLTLLYQVRDDLAAMETEKTNLNADIATAKGQIGELTTKVNTNNQRIAELATLPAIIASIQSAIAGLRAGAANSEPSAAESAATPEELAGMKPE